MLLIVIDPTVQPSEQPTFDPTEDPITDTDGIMYFFMLCHLTQLQFVYFVLYRSNN